MKKDRCEDCVHFLKHYVILDGRLLTANCGHCVFPRVKSRKPMTAACPSFTRLGLLESGHKHKYLTFSAIGR